MSHNSMGTNGLWRTWGLWLVPYNLVLLIEGVVLLFVLRCLGYRVGHHETYIYGPYIWSSILEFGIAANLAYCLGPLVELCVNWWRRRRTPYLRRILLVLGFLFSMFVIFELAGGMWRHIAGYGK